MTSAHSPMLAAGGSLPLPAIRRRPGAEQHGNQPVAASAIPGVQRDQCRSGRVAVVHAFFYRSARTVNASQFS